MVLKWEEFLILFYDKVVHLIQLTNSLKQDPISVSETAPNTILLGFK